MTFRRLLALLVPAAAAMLVAAPPALAHTELESSDPSEGASLATAPSQVQLKFAEAVTLPADPIQITGPDGAKWTVGQATIAGATITAPVRASGPAGAYVLTYKVVSDDGDQVTGNLHFSLTTGTAPSTTSAAPSSAPAPSAAAASRPAEDSAGFPVWGWVVIAVVVVAAIGGLFAARARRSS
ncbi:copper resistance protein CopC [Amycolatopsis sp. K13G38]|uniref:Copper resistance protein CopC n=1 Tax=Amycolatopsis acididurans TaxID=2724524 RepID=A0ABX1J3K3_9PSEU|nr:copper resistance CopC family protein [Amycolatopsis acididurans]NKQ52910.1 copper resistance protein CopC [Amycolatopsis acididurans]